MANIMRCCKCTTTWTKGEVDLTFDILRISFSQPYGTYAHPNQYRTCSYSDFRYSTGTGPCDYKRVSAASQAQIFDVSGPSSGCDCTNCCGGKAGPESYVGSEIIGGGTYIYTYQGYWTRKRGSGCPSIIYGRHDVTYLRQFEIVKFHQPYTNDHLCGNYCPGCGPCQPPNKNEVANIIASWRRMLPPC